MDRYEPYERFRALHEAKQGFVMPNAWDGVSALLIKKAGFKAVATSPVALAFSLGVPTGVGAVSRSEEIDNAVRIWSLSGLPVDADFEDGFGPSPDDCVQTVEEAIEAGIAGIDLDDSTTDPGRPIHDLDTAVARMKAAAGAAEGRILLTGRTRSFLHRQDDVDVAIARLVAFAEAGADVLCAPVPPDLDIVRKIVKAVWPKPVSVVAGSYDPISLRELFGAGVKRVSLGATLYCHAMAKVEEACAALVQGDLVGPTSGLWPSAISTMIREATVESRSNAG